MMMDKIKLVRLQLGNLDITDDIIKLRLSEIEQEILNFCNLREVPKELKFTWVRMVVDLIWSNHYQANPSELEVVTAVKEGDTQVGYGINKPTGVLAIEKVMKDYQNKLISFRRVKW